MADKTYSDLLTEIDFIHSLETSESSSAKWLAFYKRRANDAIAEIGELIGGISETWESADLTIDGYTITFPTGFISESSVWIDDLEQVYKTPEELDYMIGLDWRDDPALVYGYYTKLDGSFIVGSTGEVKIVGFMELPEFPANDDWSAATTYADDVYVTYNWKVYQSLQAANTNHLPDAVGSAWWVYVEDCPNPLAYLPTSLQRLPAHYVLSRIPLSGENAREINRRDDAEKEWQAGLDRISDHFRKTRNQPFGGN